MSFTRMGQKDEQPNKRKPPVKAVASTGAEKKNKKNHVLTWEGSHPVQNLTKIVNRRWLRIATHF